MLVLAALTAPGCQVFGVGLSCVDAVDCARGDVCLRSVCTSAPDAAEGEGQGGEGEGEGQGGEGEGQGGEGEGEGQPACPPGDPCNDGIDCTDDDRCQPNGVCLGLHNGSVAACGACDVDCSVQCAPCCTFPEPANPDTCATGCGTCLGGCVGGCDELCDPGTACSTRQTGGAVGPELHCTGATCRGDLTSGAVNALATCNAGSTCDFSVQGDGDLQLGCDASACTGSLHDSFAGVTASASCTTGAACTWAFDNVGVNVVCDASGCVFNGGPGAGVALSCTGAAVCTLTCDGTCTVDCGSSATACTVLCHGVDLPCAPGQQCAC